MHQAATVLWNYVHDDSAATAIEYGLMASIISIAIAMVVVQIGVSLQIIFGQAAEF